MMLEYGLVQVYTGNGKGKTTASLGLALRAVGRGMRVCMIQFIKGGGPYGEHMAAAKFSPLLTIHQTGRDTWLFRDNLDPEDVRIARESLDLGRQVLTGGAYDLVILDEINGAAWFGLISADDILALISRKPPQVELVLTGRNADSRVIDAADLVTEMVEVKHYYQQGVQARIGIEK
ncbi:MULTISPECIES: cob(I)yrinic acid a,c-diamide adenosyltransferase [Geobacter]|uniref:corrinoid adenosyltransferase n=2 Tax=Geobacter TaxID=28231 RepID=A0A0C1TQV0_9BACT|nr:MULTISPECIES: cob(I)yrinic acid a,c-diamide adenosyltransferase [Geobacter]ANA41039.1 cob(I)yrinic acid a,c-diamide adenosyltransferase [Geobacter anodireducens]KIE43149.1 cobinamide adenolsyltransferase [Geobacter soli]MBE2888167.1 cob(I)yrinic acid a,c-diamide adenosyltransferase [Geobacter anodireducens]HMN03302.1 cob(I)yrinic acid a,c-diamide adenosyltransferase [Geobacter anodireducens]